MQKEKKKNKLRWKYNGQERERERERERRENTTCQESHFCSQPICSPPITFTTIESS